MPKITIETDARELLKEIDAINPHVPPTDAFQAILTGAFLASTIVPDDDLQPIVLFDRLLAECGPPLSEQWLRSWILGEQGVYTETRAKALPVLRDHVVKIVAAWRQDLQAAIDTLHKAVLGEPSVDEIS